MNFYTIDEFKQFIADFLRRGDTDFRHSHISLLAKTSMPIKTIDQHLGLTVNECSYIHHFASAERELVNAIDQAFMKNEETDNESDK